jgi:hypothetical protein
MNIDLNLLKGLRDFIDWMQEKGSSIIHYTERKKLNNIINSITDLVTHKKVYLNRMSNALLSGKQELIEQEVQQALSVAEKDTIQLKQTIQEAQLTDSEVYRVLNAKASVLANVKLSEIERLKSLVGEGEVSQKVKEALAHYESAWTNISLELEKIKKAIGQNG